MEKLYFKPHGSGNIQDVIYAIYGKDIASSILDVNYIYEGIHVTGVVGKPEIARSNRSNQLFFVNKRFVKDKILSGAAENSFKGLLPIGKYGFLVLNVDLNPAYVDVNVHPAKLEVRFQEENKVFKAIYHAIKETLLKAELVANTEKTVEDISNLDTLSSQKTSSITDLFRKITKSQEKANSKTEEKNIIGEIYNSREENIEENKDTTFNNLNDNIVTKTEDNHDSKESIKMDMFKELMAMQQKLKEEAENNPNIHTNVNELIKDTQKLQSSEGFEEDIQLDKQENENVIQENSVSEEGNAKIYEEQEENKEETTFVKEQEESYEVVEGGTVNNTSENDIKQEELEENINGVEEQENKKEISQETRVFTSEEIQEMMNKLENIENIEDSPEFSNMYEKIFGKLPASIEQEKKIEEQKLNAYELIKDNNISVFDNIPEYQKTVYKLVGIAFNTYIIIEIQNELYIIDQHAAHERVMYEKVKKNYYENMNKDSQMLLLPDIITLTHKEMDILKDNYDMFEKAGFVFEEFGDNTIKLTGVPDICLELNTSELFLETLDEINQVARTAKQEIEERFIATVACKSAVKAHMDLTPEEVDSLMNELLKLPNPFTCPHGRPTAIKMDKNDLEKKFARRK